MLKPTEQDGRMTALEFVYWISGYFELNTKPVTYSKETFDIIKEKAFQVQTDTNIGEPGPMTPELFVVWLKGFFETHFREPFFNEQQILTIRQHLGLVMNPISVKFGEPPCSC